MNKISLLNKHLTKISLFIVIGTILMSCNMTKRVPNNKRLLLKNEIIVDDKKSNQDEVFNQLYQKQNSSILGYRLRLNIYNLAKQKTDSSYKAKYVNNPAKYHRRVKLLSKKQVNRLGHSFWYEGIHNFLKKTGEAPVILDSVSTKKSIKRLNFYYFNKGFFDVKTTYTADTSKTKIATLKYEIKKGQGYIIDSLKTVIYTKALDSMYQLRKDASYIKVGDQYTKDNVDTERTRLTRDFRNNGVFFFQQNYIEYTLDTINTSKKINLTLTINDQIVRRNDTANTQNFKIYKVSRVNIYTDSFNKNKAEVKDSALYKGFHLYSVNKKLKYRPKSIVNAVFITPGSIYSDDKTTLTTRYLSNLKVFNYPTIQYEIDPKDENALIANIYLLPRKKFTFGASVDFTRSNIQDFGISGNASVGIRNVFNGAETFEIGLRGNTGSSRYLANPDNTFFNIFEVGVDAKLNFPRVLFPINMDRLIKKSMIPYTTFSVGLAKQTNIGLDKQNFTSALTYNWTPRKNTTARFDLFNVQFVKNVNVGNYFNIYQSSYENLSTIARSLAFVSHPEYFNPDGTLIIESGTNGFINDVLGPEPTLFPSETDLKSIRSINERKIRLTENNLIFASSYSYSKTTKKELADENYYAFKTKIESAGNFLSLLARASKQLKNQGGANTFFEVEFSQYIKGELEFIKHWDLNQKKVFAVRWFGGIAIPYGNSKSVPFSRSYFGGGTNDNRAWQPYSLGPGSSGGINDFNEANMKLALNAELRFNIGGAWNGVLFADAGNIWNVLDNVEDEKYVFKGFKSLKNTALGTGFGIRYDFGIFVLRGELGFKTYNPAKDPGEKWFKEINLSQSVINIGINYPF